MTLAPEIMLAPLGALYGAAMRARLALYFFVTFSVS